MKSRKHNIEMKLNRMLKCVHTSWFDIMILLALLVKLSFLVLSMVVIADCVDEVCISCVDVLSCVVDIVIMSSYKYG